MLRVYAIVVEQHDLVHVTAAALICAFAAFTGLSLYTRAAESARPAVRLRWLTVTAVVIGSGMWATHFVVKLGFVSQSPIGYDIGLTILSIAVAIAGAWFGFGITLYRPRLAAVGGAVVGAAAIGGMCFIGMAAIRVKAAMIWDSAYVVASVVFGIALCAAALWTTARASNVLARALGALPLALGIFGVHFIAAAASSLAPDPGILVPDDIVHPGTLALVIAIVAIFIVAVGLTGSIIDRRLAERATREAQRVRAYAVELEQIKRRLEATAAEREFALRAADSGNIAKSSFLAAASHELRTPLNAVIGFAEMLATEPFGPLGDSRYLGYVKDIRASGAHLLNTINGILEFSKTEAGRVTLHESEVDLGAALSDTLEEFRVQAESGGVALGLEAETNLPRLRGDAQRICLILHNLLSNAVKFTPKGGAVRARAFRRGNDLAVAIADTGIGMAREDISKAFENFVQIDGRLSRRYDGLGIGLPLAKQLMELHGGTVELDSAPGRGTTVTATFPAARLCAPAAAGGGKRSVRAAYCYFVSACFTTALALAKSMRPG